MLTDKEREWLERRERHEYPFCISCGAIRTAVDGVGYCYPIEECPLEARIEDWQEAAEFEARVAVKLANIHFGTEDCEFCGGHICADEFCCDCHVASTAQHCLVCRLKTARLQVEEEMDDA